MHSYPYQVLLRLAHGPVGRSVIRSTSRPVHLPNPVASADNDEAMCRATFRFYGELNDFRPHSAPTASIECSESPSVKDRIEACGVPHTEVAFVLANGKAVDFTYRLGDGDRISVYPAFSSLVPDFRLRPDPPQGRFVVDVNLGRLARYLRLLGFDALSDGELLDGDLARISAEQNRILLTKDRNLLKRSLVVHGYLVREVYPRRQLVEVVRRYRLGEAVRPFARCMDCSGVIEPVAKADIDHLLEPLTRQHFDDFRRCTGCDRIFWRGSHYDRLAEIVDEVRDSLAD